MPTGFKMTLNPTVIPLNTRTGQISFKYFPDQSGRDVYISRNPAYMYGKGQAYNEDSHDRTGYMGFVTGDRFKTVETKPYSSHGEGLPFGGEYRTPSSVAGHPEPSVAQERLLPPPISVVMTPTRYPTTYATTYVRKRNIYPTCGVECPAPRPKSAKSYVTTNSLYYGPQNKDFKAVWEGMICPTARRGTGPAGTSGIIPKYAGHIPRVPSV